MFRSNVFDKNRFQALFEILTTRGYIDSTRKTVSTRRPSSPPPPRSLILVGWDLFIRFETRYSLTTPSRIISLLAKANA